MSYRIVVGTLTAPFTGKDISPWETNVLIKVLIYVSKICWLGYNLILFFFFFQKMDRLKWGDQAYGNKSKHEFDCRSTMLGGFWWMRFLIVLHGGLTMHRLHKNALVLTSPFCTQLSAGTAASTSDATFCLFQYMKICSGREFLNSSRIMRPRRCPNSVTSLAWHHLSKTFFMRKLYIGLVGLFFTVEIFLLVGFWY